MSTYLILALVVVSHCAQQHPHSLEINDANVSPTHTNIVQDDRRIPECDVSFDVEVTTDPARAYAAVESGRRVFRVGADGRSGVGLGVFELHRESETTYRFTESRVQP